MKEQTNPTQTITVETTPVETKVAEKTPQLISEQGVTNLTLLTDAQKAKCLEVTKNINAKDVGSATNYGVTITKYISESGNGLLTTKSINDETDAIINDIMSDLNQIDLSDLKERSAFRKFIESLPIVRNLVTTLEDKIAKYQTVQAKVNSISDNINNANLRAISDNNQLQNLYDSLTKYVAELDTLIIAGDYRISVEEENLQKMKESGNTPSNELIRQQNFITEFERQVDTLRDVKALSQTQLFEILMTQTTNVAVVSNTRTLQTIVMGAFANQLKILVAQSNQRKAIETMNKVKAGVNKAMKASAETLKNNTKEMAKFANESIIEAETLDVMANSIKDAFEISQQTVAEYRSKRDERKQKYAEIANKFNEIGNMFKAQAQIEQDTSVGGISLTE